MFVIDEFFWVIDTKGKLKKATQFLKDSDENRGKEWADMSDSYKTYVRQRVPLILLFLLWMFAGLFTWNWPLFLFFLAFELVIAFPVLKLAKDTILHVPITFLNSVAGLMFGIFLIINTYHLHIDLYELFKTLF